MFLFLMPLYGIALQTMLFHTVENKVQTYTSPTHSGHCNILPEQPRYYVFVTCRKLHRYISKNHWLHA